MPKLPTNYQNTVIYKIQHIEKDELIYIGHTTSFTKRKSQHKQCCSNEKSEKYHLKVYKMIRDNGGWNSFSMIELYKFPCLDAREAACEEDKVMREYKNSMGCMNSQRSYTTPEEKAQYSIENKDKLYEQRKQYRLEHKDIITERKKKFYEDNKEKIKEKHKIYRLENKDKIKENNKKYKDKISEKNKQKFTCECGSECRISDKQKHFRTAKHIKFLENK